MIDPLPFIRPPYPGADYLELIPRSELKKLRDELASTKDKLGSEIVRAYQADERVGQIAKRNESLVRERDSARIDRENLKASFKSADAALLDLRGMYAKVVAECEKIACERDIAGIAIQKQQVDLAKANAALADEKRLHADTRAWMQKDLCACTERANTLDAEVKRLRNELIKAKEQGDCVTADRDGLDRAYRTLIGLHDKLKKEHTELKGMLLMLTAKPPAQHNESAFPKINLAAELLKLLSEAEPLYGWGVSYSVAELALNLVCRARVNGVEFVAEGQVADRDLSARMNTPYIAHKWADALRAAQRAYRPSFGPRFKVAVQPDLMP